MGEEKKRLDEALELRRRQLSFVLNAIADLKEGWESDRRAEAARERLLAMSAGGEEGQGQTEGQNDDETLGDGQDMQMD